MTTHSVVLISGDDDAVAILTRRLQGRSCRVTCGYRGKEIHGEARDYFDALCQIRTMLEKEGLLLFCHGASLNVFPSGMARDMGQGLKAYRLEMGRPGRDLVGIFESGPDVNPSSVERQRAFWTDWLASIAPGRRLPS